MPSEWVWSAFGVVGSRRFPSVPRSNGCRRRGLLRSVSSAQRAMGSFRRWLGKNRKKAAFGSVRRSEDTLAFEVRVWDASKSI